MFFSQGESRIQERHLSYGFVCLDVEAQNLCRLPSAAYVSFGVELEAVPDSRALRETPRGPEAQGERGLWCFRGAGGWGPPEPFEGIALSLSS